MIQKDPMVEALIALCKAEGGYVEVAEKADVSAQNLWQIINGVKLKSGNPRGVGPKVRSKISVAYPDWLASGVESLPMPLGTQPVNLGLSEALQQLSAFVTASDDLTRDQLKPLFNRMLDEPQRSNEILHRIESVISSSTGARSGNMPDQDMPGFLKK